MKEKKYWYEERRWQEEFKSRKGVGRETMIEVNLLVSFRSTIVCVNRYDTEVLKNRFLQNAVERCTTVLVQSSEVVLVKTKEYCIPDLIHLH